MKTLEILHAGIGSISTGTLRSEDLLEAFANELEWQIRRNGDYFSRPENRIERDKLNAIVGEAQDCWAENGTDLDEAKLERIEELINETLPDALQFFCPLHFYFGSHIGDGADFGYWVNIEDVRESVEFTSTENQDYPDDDFRGEWLHVSDHGNATLYCRGEDGKDVEIWSLV